MKPITGRHPVPVSRRTRVPTRWVDVLVYCDVCDKWIAHEVAHACRLTAAERDLRRLCRNIKVRELMDR